MSELKATTAQEIVRNEKDCDYMDELFGGVKMPPTQVYLKSEADKVISELKADYDEVRGRLQTANLIKDEQMAKVAKQSEVISSLKCEIVNLERRVYAANRDARRSRY